MGIPKSLRELMVDNPDIDLLAENAMKDACAGANPVYFDKEKLVEFRIELVGIIIPRSNS